MFLKIPISINGFLHLLQCITNIISDKMPIIKVTPSINGAVENAPIFAKPYTKHKKASIISKIPKISTGIFSGL